MSSMTYKDIFMLVNFLHIYVMLTFSA